MKQAEPNSRQYETARNCRFIALLSEHKCYVNLAGDYDYLESGYYVSQDYEHDGKPILPTCKDMLDAYVPPLLLEKAKAAGIPIPEYYISNGYFEPPVIVDPINPFTLKGRVIHRPGRAKSIAKSLTRNHTYAVCCQELPSGSRVVYFRSVLGWCVNRQFRELSRRIWEVFKIPVARIRSVRLTDGTLLLSDISPLPYETLHTRELQHITECVKWDN